MLLRRLALDLCAWAALPAVFLSAYIHVYAAPVAAVLPHLRLMLTVFLALALCRLMFAWTAPRAARLLSATVAGIALLLVLAYYLLVLVGLKSWGQVVSWQLISSYAGELPTMARTLGLSWYAAAFAPLALMASGFGLAWTWLRMADWAPLLAGRLRARLLGTVLLLGTGIVAAEVFHFTLSPAVEAGEPLALTFFSERVARKVQGHVIDRFTAERLDREEDGVRAAYQPAASSPRPNLVMIVVDGLRPDRMGVYGHARDTTPWLSAQVKQGAALRVDGVRSSCAESLCGLLSLASSRYVHEFSNRPFTLQQVLRRHGYKIHMVLGGDHTNFYGLKEMYGDVDSYYDGSAASGYYRNDDRLVTSRVRAMPAWDGQPVMLQFHLMSAHILGERLPAYQRYLPSESYVLPHMQTAAHAESRFNFYDNGVLQTDAVVKELLDLLEARGYLGNALVVVTADHGEALGEHGRYAHANSVFEPVLRIPLLLLPYGQPAPSLQPLPAAGQVDIAPTILRAFGMPQPSSWSGRPLQEHGPRGAVYFEEGPEAGLVEAREAGAVWKFWLNPRAGTRHAFRLDQDPHEARDLIGRMPEADAQAGAWRMVLLRHGRAQQDK